MIVIFVFQKWSEDCSIKSRGTVSLTQKLSKIAKIYFSALSFASVLGSSSGESSGMSVRMSSLVRPSYPGDL